MGDRTFGSDDVIRIFQDHLTRAEQIEVEEFFAVAPTGEELVIARSLQTIVIELLEILPQFPFIFLGIFLRMRLFTLIGRIRSGLTVLNDIISRGEDDA